MYRTTSPSGYLGIRPPIRPLYRKLYRTQRLSG